MDSDIHRSSSVLGRPLSSGEAGWRRLEERRRGRRPVHYRMFSGCGLGASLARVRRRLERS